MSHTEPLGEHAYSRLLQAIVRGRLAAGVHLVEEELAEALGIGRTPLREALRRLLHEGFLLSKPGRRIRLVVAPMSRDDMTELFEVAALLEGAAAARAATLPGAQRSMLVRELRVRDAEFTAAATERPRQEERLFLAHQAFHGAVFAAGAFPRLRAAHAPMRRHVDRYEWLYGRLLGDQLAVTIDEHHDIIAAIAAGEAAGAEAAMRLNWRNAATRLATVPNAFDSAPAGLAAALGRTRRRRVGASR